MDTKQLTIRLGDGQVQALDKLLEHPPLSIQLLGVTSRNDLIRVAVAEFLNLNRSVEHSS